MAIGALWVVIGVLWSGRYLQGGGLVACLMAAAVAAVWVGGAVVGVARKDDPWGSATRGLVLVALVVVPAVFDLRTADGFNLVKYTATVMIALVAVSLWGVSTSRGGRTRCQNGLLWPVVGLVTWTAVTTAASPNPTQSLLGAHHSYDGLFATVALVVIFFAISRTFRLDQVSTAMSVLYFGAGGLVAMYGMFQLHDRVWHGSRWDFVHWGDASTFSPTETIWSSFGNPNHLAGFLAILLPIGLALAVMRRRWTTRGLIFVLTGLMVAELLKTESRGALLAALAASGTVALFLFLRGRKPLTIKRTVSAALILAAVGLAAVGGAVVLGAAEPGGPLDVSSGSIAAQRVEFWRSAVRMANDRPLTGTGPDGYEGFYFAYNSPKLARLFGPEIGTNGPHNVFMNYLATQGYPGLVAFTLVLGFAGLQARRAWRSLGKAASGAGGPVSSRAGEARIMLVGVGAGLVAYIVQASFNVQQIGLSFVFWALLGLLCVITRGAVALGSPAGGSDVPMPRASAHGKGMAVWVKAVVVGALVVVVAGSALRPYRADRSYRAYLRDDEAARREALAWPDSERAGALSRRAEDHLERAATLNPWEPFYLALVADVTYDSAVKLPNGSPRQLLALSHARSQYKRVVTLAPWGTSVLERYAEVLLAIDQFDPSEGSARAAAIAALRQAVRANPFDTRLEEKLHQVLDS